MSIDVLENMLKTANHFYYHNFLRSWFIVSSILNQSFHVGDWVSGTSFKDERFRGYIEQIHGDSGKITVRIIESDHKEAVGKITRSHIRRIKKLPISPLQSPGQVFNLIDLALTSRDKEWFLELLDQLKKLQQKEKERPIDPSISLPLHRWKKYV